jgi:enoyl-CoA hydratase/carnithine racemase
MSNTVLKELKDGILLLTLNRPEKKNAFNTQQWKALATELDAARENDDVTVVVITGAGNDFSAGQDLTDTAVPGALLSYRILERAVVNFDKPLIAAARGVAVGGGATVLFHADVLYVGESLRMRMPFNSLAMAPEFASSYMLQMIIGPQRAAELLFTTEWINADKALETGIASRKFNAKAASGSIPLKACPLSFCKPRRLVRSRPAAVGCGKSAGSKTPCWKVSEKTIKWLAGWTRQREVSVNEN